MVTLRPTASFYIQRGTSTADPEEQGIPIFSFNQPDGSSDGGTPFDVEITESIADYGHVTTMQMTVEDLKKDEVLALPPNPLIRIDAGYLNVPSIPKQPVFFGFMNRILPMRAAGVVKWTISGAGVPSVLMASRVIYNAAEGDSIADAINAILSLARLPEAVLPDIADTIILTDFVENYSASSSIIDEIKFLVSILSEQTNRAFTVVPNLINPYQIQVIDISLFGTQEVISLDFDSNIITDVQPTSESADLADAPTFDGTTDPVSIYNSAQVSTLRVSMAFDPRVHVGMTASYKGEIEGEGSFSITEVSHSISASGPWKTTITGPLSGTGEGSIVS